MSTESTVRSIIANHLSVTIDELQVQEALVAVVFIIHASIDNGIIALIRIISAGLIAIVRPSILSVSSLADKSEDRRE